MSDQFAAGVFAAAAFVVALVALRVVFGSARPRADRPVWHPLSRTEAAAYLAVAAVAYAVLCVGQLTRAGLLSAGGALLLLAVALTAVGRLLVLHRRTRVDSRSDTRR